MLVLAKTQAEGDKLKSEKHWKLWFICSCLNWEAILPLIIQEIYWKKLTHHQLCSKFNNPKHDFIAPSHIQTDKPVFFLSSHADDTPETCSIKHVIKSLVDFWERDLMGDEFLQLKLLKHHNCWDQQLNASKLKNNSYWFVSSDKSFKIQAMVLSPCLVVGWNQLSHLQNH